MRQDMLGATVFAALLATAVASGPTVAQTTQEQSAGDSEWSFGIAPYVWMAGLHGDMGAFGQPPVDVDISFSDILDNLDMTVMGAGEVRYGRFGLYMDLVYLHLQSDKQGTPGPLFSGVKLKSKTLFFTPMLEYRVLEDGGSFLDAMAGIRLWHASTELKFSAGLATGRTLKDDATWVDPTIGAKGNFALGEDWVIKGWGIVGGGFGFSSDFMWDAFGGVGYKVNDWLSVDAGYRGTGTDYAKDGYVFDAITHGPIIGATFRF